MSNRPALEHHAGIHRRPHQRPDGPAVAVTGDDPGLSRRILRALAADALPVRGVPDAPGALGEGDVLVAACDILSRPRLAALRRLRRQTPARPLVIVAPVGHGAGVRQALDVGADGFVLESRLEETLAATVRAVHAGLVCAPREMRRLVAKPSFSPREKQILAMVAVGSTNSEIADALFLTESTIKTHLASAFGKLGVHSRRDAAALLLDPDEGLQATALPVALISGDRVPA